MKILNFILLLICLCCCQPQEVHTSYECGNLQIAKSIENCLITVAMIRSGQAVPFEDRWKAIECLDALSSHESQIVKDSDAPYLYYRGVTDFEANEKYQQDFSAWLTWWKNNRCSLTNEDVENAFKSRGKEIGGNLNWPDSYYSHVENNKVY